MAKKQQLNILETEVGEAVKSSELFGKMQYAEEIGIGNGSCDLVYYSDTKVIAIELKTKVNMKVMAQAIRWLDTASKVYVACPGRPNKDARRVLRALGIGYIGVFRVLDLSDGRTRYAARILIRPMELPADLDYWLPEIKGMEKHLEAGTKSGERSTVFSRFITRAKEYARKHPDATLNTIAMQVPNHYATKSSCVGALRRYAKFGVIEKFWAD